jgi:periplasmic copper chaperone A
VISNLIDDTTSTNPAAVGFSGRAQAIPTLRRCALPEPGRRLRSLSSPRCSRAPTPHQSLFSQNFIDESSLIMFKDRPTLRRTVLRVGLPLAAALAAALMLPGAANAHVSVQPDTIEGGGFSVIAFRVPNERDDASTTRLKVILPEDQPLGEVSTTPIPGWSVKTTTRKLDQPIDVEGVQLDTVVSQVTWTATEAGIQPGEYQDFALSLGQLPASGQLVFQAVQSYSSGDRVTWNQVSADGSAEPEHPAPTLTITPATATAAHGDGSGPVAGSDGQTAADATTTEATSADAIAETGTANDSGSTLPIVLSAAALVVSLLTAFLVWRRGRPAANTGAPSALPLEDTRI